MKKHDNDNSPDHTGSSDAGSDTGTPDQASGAVDDGRIETKKGSTSAKLIVTLTVDENGGLWSSHDVSDKDRQTLAQWPGMGLRHIVHGLLTETVRREAFLLLMMEMSQDNKYLDAYQVADENSKQAITDALAVKIEQQIKNTLPKLSPQSAREVLEMIANQG